MFALFASLAIIAKGSLVGRLAPPCEDIIWITMLESYGSMHFLYRQDALRRAKDYDYIEYERSDTTCQS